MAVGGDDKDVDRLDVAAQSISPSTCCRGRVRHRRAYQINRGPAYFAGNITSYPTLTWEYETAAIARRALASIHGEERYVMMCLHFTSDDNEIVKRKMIGIRWIVVPANRHRKYIAMSEG